MILYLQIILITVLVVTLVALYFDERQKKREKAPVAKLTRVWEENERRTFVRINADVPVRYNIPKKVNNPKPVKTKNISVGGIAISLNEKLALRDRISLEMEMPDVPTPVMVIGEVVWIREDVEQEDQQGVRHFSAGIEFKEILPKDQAKISKFIKKCGKS